MLFVFAKIVNWFRENFTYQRLLVTLTLCILALGYYNWPFFCSFFQKQSCFDLNLPPDTIPFLLIEQNKENELLQSIYIAYWDLSLGTLYKDDAEPICEVTGEIGNVFWTGNKQIILSPANERGTLDVIIRSNDFSIETKQTSDEKFYLFKPSYNGKKLYCVSLHKKTGDLSISYQLGKKLITIEQTQLKEFPDCLLTQPIFLIAENDNLFVYCFFQKKDKPEHGTGIMLGTLQNNQLSWEIWKQVDPTIKQSTIASCSLIQENIIISEKEKLFTSSINQNEFLGLSSANNYLNMFYQYLFGDGVNGGFVSRQGFFLVEQGLEPPTIRSFQENLIINWCPSFVCNTSYYVKQVLAIREKRVIGRIELMGENIRLFQDTRLISEEKAEDLFLIARWVFPNE